jgi:hypothetical protein
MRPPRYRFPDDVRNATREMAARMVREGTVPETPEQLSAWIAGRPEVQGRLERGGYGTAFTSDDLLPLLHVFVVDAGGAPARPAAGPPAVAERGWLTGALILLAVVLLVVGIVVML